MFQRVSDHLILKSVSRTTRPSPGRIASLDDELADHPVEHHTIVESFSGQENKVVNRFGRVLGVELHFDLPSVGFDAGLIRFFCIDLHGGGAGPLFFFYIFFSSGLIIGLFTSLRTGKQTAGSIPGTPLSWFLLLLASLGCLITLTESDPLRQGQVR